MDGIASDFIDSDTPISRQISTCVSKFGHAMCV